MTADATQPSGRPALEAGDRVVLLLPGSQRYVDVVAAMLTAGVVPVPLDPALTPDEQQRLLADLRPARVVTSPDELDDLRLPAPRTDGLPRCRPMHVTSGTTGTPKGVWSGLLDDRAARAVVEEERAMWGFREDDVHLVLSPLHHSAPLRFAHGTLLAGGRIVVPGRFDPAAATAAIEADRPTTTFCVPTHLQRLLAHWDEVGVPDLSSFRLVAHAGAACPPDLKERVLEVFPGDAVWEFYGSTEGQFTACSSGEWRERPGTVGRARPGRTLLVDDDGQIWCVVPEHARFSYWSDPAKTVAAWRETPSGPAFTVGDLGRLDEAGYLFLDGRREDLVISGGVNVYPVEVENALRQHPGVVDVAVFGVPDPRWGSRVCAAIVGDADVEALRALAAARLAPAKRPKDYHRLDALPLTATGKVRRSALADLVAGGRGAVDTPP